MEWTVQPRKGMKKLNKVTNNAKKTQKVIDKIAQ